MKPKDKERNLRKIYKLYALRELYSLYQNFDIVPISIILHFYRQIIFVPPLQFFEGLMSEIWVKCQLTTCFHDAIHVPESNLLMQKITRSVLPTRTVVMPPHCALF